MKEKDYAVRNSQEKAARQNNNKKAYCYFSINYSKLAKSSYAPWQVNPEEGLNLWQKETVLFFPTFHLCKLCAQYAIFLLLFTSYSTQLRTLANCLQPFLLLGSGDFSVEYFIYFVRFFLFCFTSI